MDYQYLIVNVEDGLGIVTLNRPQVLNALSPDVCKELLAAFSALENNPEVRVVIVTGGTQVFAAGADISAMVNASVVEILNRGGMRVVVDFIESMNKPVIAAVSGYALGGGCELALACDVRIATESATFGLPEIKLGIIPGAGGTQRLARLVGLGRAKDLIFSGDFIDAREAYRIGLVNRVVPVEQLLDAAKERAQKYMRHGAVALAAAKMAITKGANVDLDTGQAIESLYFSTLFATEDQKEGMRAFLEKRRPNFQGR